MTTGRRARGGRHRQTDRRGSSYSGQSSYAQRSGQHVSANIIYITSRSTWHCSGYYKTCRNPTHQRGLDPCWTCALRSTCASRSPWSWSCLDSKLVDLTHFTGSRALCWPVTMHLAPSNLVASLAPSLQWGEEVQPQKCRGTVSCAIRERKIL